jgi:hypothetical protein
MQSRLNIASIVCAYKQTNADLLRKLKLTESSHSKVMQVWKATNKFRSILARTLSVEHTRWKNNDSCDKKVDVTLVTKEIKKNIIILV